MQATGSVSVAPNVLVRLVSLAIREIPGVARAGSLSPASALGAAVGSGIAVKVIDDAVAADCYIIAAPEINLLELGVTVQATVAAVIQDLAGMAVREVNVYIQDVESVRG